MAADILYTGHDIVAEVVNALYKRIAVNGDHRDKSAELVCVSFMGLTVEFYIHPATNWNLPSLTVMRNPQRMRVRLYERDSNTTFRELLWQLSIVIILVENCQTSHGLTQLYDAINPDMMFSSFLESIRADHSLALYADKIEEYDQKLCAEYLR